MSVSRRTGVVAALVALFKNIDGNSPYSINLFSNVYPTLKFWDEVKDFPALYLVSGAETREYLPANFVWGYLNVGIKVYTKGESSGADLELLLEDIEHAIDSTRGSLLYNSDLGYETTQLSITSITTDEGLLSPFSIGEVNLLVRYQVM
jgi:hypothetical protein